MIWTIKRTLRRVFLCPFGRHLNTTTCSSGEAREVLTQKLVAKWSRPWETRCCVCKKVDQKETDEWNSLSSEDLT